MHLISLLNIKSIYIHVYIFLYQRYQRKSNEMMVLGLSIAIYYVHPDEGQKLLSTLTNKPD